MEQRNWKRQTPLCNTHRGKEVLVDSVVFDFLPGCRAVRAGMGTEGATQANILVNAEEEGYHRGQGRKRNCRAAIS